MLYLLHQMPPEREVPYNRLFCFGFADMVCILEVCIDVCVVLFLQHYIMRDIEIDYRKLLFIQY